MSTENPFDASANRLPAGAPPPLFPAEGAPPVAPQPQPGYPLGAAPTADLYAPSAPPVTYAAPPKRNSGLVIGLVVAGTVLIAILAAGVTIVAALVRGLASPPPFPGPMPVPSTSVTPLDPTAEWASPDAIDRTQRKLDALREKYTVDEGSPLWKQIPRTEQNQIAVRAFDFLIADRSVALIWASVTPETLHEYESEAREFERRLLAQEPLGESVHVTYKDGTVLEYDGDTGAGSYG